MSLKIACISDTHEQEDLLDIPDSNVIVGAGDITFRGSLSKLDKFCNWLNKQKSEYKVFTIGNHDLFIENNKKEAINIVKKYNIHMLHEESITINNIKFYFSGTTPTFGYGWALNVDRFGPIAKKWDLIPLDTNVLVTHGPPFGRLDLLDDNKTHVGCEELTKRIKKLNQLKASIFGHIHHSYGSEIFNGITYVNASSCNERYNIVNPPITITL